MKSSKLLTLLLSSTFLVACGGGGGDSSPSSRPENTNIITDTGIPQSHTSADKILTSKEKQKYEEAYDNARLFTKEMKKTGAFYYQENGPIINAINSIDEANSWYEYVSSVYKVRGFSQSFSKRPLTDEQIDSIEKTFKRYILELTVVNKQYNIHNTNLDQSYRDYWNLLRSDMSKDLNRKVLEEDYKKLNDDFSKLTTFILRGL